MPGDVQRSHLFQNPGNANGWVNLKLSGTQANRAAIGARIHVTVKNPDGTRHFYRTVSSGGSFGSSPLMQHIGLGNATAIESVEVGWPGGTATLRMDNVPLKTTLQIKQPLMDQR